MILPADNSRTTVSLDKQEYKDKIALLLSDSNTYTLLRNDPTNKYRNQLISLLQSLEKQGTIQKDLYWMFYPTAD